MSDPNDIVTVQVSTILAPAAATLQQTGCFVSFGATNLTPQTTSLLTRFSDLTPLLLPARAITTAVWVLGVVTVTTTLPLPFTIGSIQVLQINGFTPVAYNGVFLCTITAASEFTYPLVTNPTPAVVHGTYISYAAVQLNAMAATYFRQGYGRNISVLELGIPEVFADEVTTLETWLNNNPLAFYGYFLPEEFGNVGHIPEAIQFFQQFENPEAMVYFWVTLEDPTAVGLILPTMKCVFQLIEDPTVRLLRYTSIIGNYAEFSLAGVFYWALYYKPTSVTRVAPMCFKYVYGVTPYNILSAGPLFVSFKANNVNYIRTGAEGGIAYTYVYMGVTADGFDYFNWWWTIDWVQINVKLDLANAIINGTNNPLAPLYYDQPGINQLEAVLAGTMKRGGGYGMVNGLVVQTQLDSDDLMTAITANTYEGQCNVNAVPFLAYSEQNPSDYGIGEYDGLSTLFIPARGFVHVLVSVVATDIVTL
jgi:hypothetical protein